MSAFDTLLFCCAICRREIRDYPNRNGRDRHLAPICRLCEGQYNERTGKPKGGSFMDRRKALQINALAECLRGAAYAKQWEGRYGRA